MYNLVLNRQNSEHVLVQVQALVVREEDLVHLEVARVGQAAVLQVHQVECVVLERRARVGCHSLVARVHLVEVRPQLIGDVGGRTHHHVLAVLAEQAALPVQLLRALAHVDGVLLLKERARLAATDSRSTTHLEEPAEHLAPDLVVLAVVAVGHAFALGAVQKVAGRRGALVRVYFQGRLVC